MADRTPAVPGRRRQAKLLAAAPAPALVLAPLPQPHAIVQAGPMNMKKDPVRVKKQYSLTRFGCKTCKARRIRCDESRPNCHNCIKAGRKCDRPVQHRDPMGGALDFAAPLTLSHFQPSRSRGLRHDEVAYLDRFRNRLVDGIVGDFSRPSWKRLILQAVHEEPALCHAAIAYSALHGLPEDSESRWITDGPADEGAAPNKRLALSRYNQCIKDLQQVIARKDSTSTNVTLLCTLLCMCFELRIRNPFNALSHLEHSLRILEAKGDTVDEDLVMAFTRLDVESAVCIGRRAPVVSVERFSNIKIDQDGESRGADKEFTSILSRIFTFIRTKADAVRYYSAAVQVPSDLVGEAMRLEKEMHCFRDEHLPEALPTKDTAKELGREKRSLWLKYLAALTLLMPSVSMEEAAFDRFLPEFTSMVALGEAIMEYNRDTSSWRNELSLNMGLIHPLFKVAQKCRSPSIRRKAIQLLADVPGPEGAWEGEPYKLYAERVMQLEEEGLDLDLSKLEDIEPSIVPELKRVHVLEIWPVGDKRTAVTFRRRPNGLGTDWEDILEMKQW